jgi:SAM-dependent methyltransferase
MMMTIAQEASTLAVEIFRCPRCRQAVADDPARSRLCCTGRRGSVPNHGRRLFDFLGRECPDARAILDWPDDFWDDIQPHLDDLRDGKTIHSSDAVLLRQAGLIDANGSASPLGRLIAYHQLERAWQAKGDPLRDLIEARSALGERSRVLDVGCGAGATLALMAPHRPALRVGLDCTLSALALADRIHAHEGGDPITLVRGDALAMPFRDGGFTHVLSRVSLNYLPQFQALREMIRVLAPGGYLALRFEALGFDLLSIRKTPGLRGKLARCRALFAGLLFNGCAIPIPLGLLGGQRQYASVYRLRRLLQRSNCEIIQTENVERSPRCVGIASQTVLLARKREQT